MARRSPPRWVLERRQAPISAHDRFRRNETSTREKTPNHTPCPLNLVEQAGANVGYYLVAHQDMCRRRCEALGTVTFRFRRLPNRCNPEDPCNQSPDRQGSPLARARGEGGRQIMVFQNRVSRQISAWDGVGGSSCWSGASQREGHGGAGGSKGSRGFRSGEKEPGPGAIWVQGAVGIPHSGVCVG